jgi:hypothetical protein
MNKVYMIVLISLLYIGCTGAPVNIVFNDDGKTAYKMEEVYSIGLLTPTYQWKRTSLCAVEVTHIQSNDFGSGYDSKSVKDCAVIGKDDGFTNDIASPIGPSVLGASGTIGAGSLIGSGLRDSGSNSVNNATSSTSTVINQNCRGNCGGGRR